MTRPRYAEIAELLASGIGDGRHAIGSLLPTEHELSASYGVSRATIREALRQLQLRGLIARSQGIGSRVVANDVRTRYVLSAQSATETMGYTTQTRFVPRTRRFLRAGPSLARLLGATPGSEWLHLSGLRLLSDDPKRPLAVSDIYVASQFAELADAANAESPIYVLIERKRAVQITEIAQDITAINLTAGQARALRAQAGGCGLRVLRRFSAADGQPVEVTINIHPAERFSFSLKLHPPPG